MHLSASPTVTPTCPSNSVPCAASTSRGTRAVHRCSARAANTPSAGTVCRIWMWVSLTATHTCDAWFLNTSWKMTVPPKLLTACWFKCRVTSSWDIMTRGRAETSWDTQGPRSCGTERRWGGAVWQNSYWIFLSCSHWSCCCLTEITLRDALLWGASYCKHEFNSGPILPSYD